MRIPGETLTYRVQRGARDARVCRSAVESSSRTAGASASPACGLRIDPAVAERSAVVVRYGLGESLVQGSRKTWELSAFTVRMLGRIVTGDASLKNISGPLTMADIAGQSAQAGTLVFVELPRADQHQPRRAEPVAGSATGWRAFTVLSRRNYQRQSRIRPCVRGRSAHRHGDARRADGPGALQ